MLDILPNKAELFYVTESMFDVESAVAGLTQCRADRSRCSVIRIGVKHKGWHKNIVAQLKERFTIPPNLNSLQTMQRSFTRNMRPMITDTIINNRDVYDEAIKDDEKKSKRLSTTSPSTDIPATPDKPNNNTSTVSNDPNNSMLTPSSSKRPLINPPACNIISPQPIISGSVMKG